MMVGKEIITGLLPITTNFGDKDIVGVVKENTFHFRDGT